jgi:hypothetical protein
MSCLDPSYNPIPSKQWSRVQTNCYKSSILQYNSQLQMASKGNILQYKSNSSNLTQKQIYALIVQGKWVNKTKTWATQTTNYTNPNINNLTKINNTLICNSNTSTLCLPTYNSNVPGPAINLCYNINTPTYYPKKRYTMNNSSNKWPINSKLIKSANGINAINTFP